MRTVIVLLPLVLAPAVARGSAALLPSPERWFSHLTRELLPAWDRPSDPGNSVGSSASNRCDDGTVLGIPRPGVRPAFFDGALRAPDSVNGGGRTIQKAVIKDIR